MKKLVTVLFVCCVLPLCAQEKEPEEGNRNNSTAERGTATVTIRYKIRYSAPGRVPPLLPDYLLPWKDTKTRGLCKTGH
jgi:hypothetical protein